MIIGTIWGHRTQIQMAESDLEPQWLQSSEVRAFLHAQWVNVILFTLLFPKYLITRILHT